MIRYFAQPNFRVIYVSSQFTSLPGCAHLLSCGLLAVLWGGSRSGTGRPKHPYGEEPVAASPFAAGAQAGHYREKKTRSVHGAAVMRADAGGIVPSVQNWSCVACTFEHNGAVMCLRS